MNDIQESFRLSIFWVLLLAVFATPSLSQEEEQKSKGDFAKLSEASKLIAARDFEQAATLLKQVVDQDPDSEQGWRLLGYSLHAAGKLDEAIAAHQQATRFESTKALAHYNLACAFSMKNNVPDALAHLEKSIDAGFDNFKHIKNDSDLDNIRTNKAFTNIMSNLESSNFVYVCPPCGCASCGEKTFTEPGTCPDCKMKLVKSNKILNVAIVIWDGVELLDFAGPGEVFASARSVDGRSFNVFTVSQSKQPIKSQGFLDVTPTYSLADCPKIDIIVLPGGGTSGVVADSEFMAQLKQKVDSSKIVLSVCTGASILGEYGYLDDLDVTTWHGAIDRMQADYPKARFHKDRRFVDNGRIVTSAGVSAGIDSSLHVVARLLGKPTATKTAEYMEYHWRHDDEKSTVSGDTR